jgi:hypothetical protein
MVTGLRTPIPIMRHMQVAGPAVPFHIERREIDAAPVVVHLDFLLTTLLAGLRDQNPVSDQLLALSADFALLAGNVVTDAHWLIYVVGITPCDLHNHMQASYPVKLSGVRLSAGWLG